MTFEEITGESMITGQPTIELTRLSWSVTRSASAIRGSSRGDPDVHVDEIVVSKVLDSTSAKLLKEALVGRLNRKVTIEFVRTGRDKPIVYAAYDLTDCGITSYKLESQGDIPVETLNLNFLRITARVFKIGDNLRGTQDTASYDQATGRAG
ncbi:MAG TPA: type VI secretion system tube protein Hcp [Crenalkalicoccus sp.]|nr:type VI secretion system tube protein Hcp [Crenalkalicoccus sp.]